MVYATNVLDQVLRASLPVITMDAELQVTTGPYLATLGYITEAEGDQPGCLAALNEEVIQMGFRPLVYGNIKGYLNHTPSVDEMRYWAAKQGISLDKVTSFTDGTKVQIEQVLVANGLGAGITQSGLTGVPADDVSSGAAILAAKATSLGYPISDFILSLRSLPVFSSWPNMMRGSGSICATTRWATVRTILCYGITISVTLR